MNQIRSQISYLPDQMKALKLPASHFINMKVAVNAILLNKEKLENYTTVVNESKQSSMLHHEIVSIPLLPIIPK